MGVKTRGKLPELTLDHALNTTGNHAPEYKMLQKTTVTKIGNVITEV